MFIDLLFSPLGIKRCTHLESKTGIAIDVLRATTTMMYAFNGFDNNDINNLKGVKEIIPAKDIETAYEIYKTVDQENYLLAGERDGFPPEGFHFGNSPYEFISNKIQGKSLVMATTNGTKTLNLLKNCKNILVGSFLNAFAVARECIELNQDIVIACAGRSDISGLEDIICGGLIGLHINDLAKEKYRKVELSDGIKIAMRTYNSYPDVLSIIRDSDHAEYLIERGLEKDLLPASYKNKFYFVPYLKDGKIVPKLLEPVLFCGANF